VLHIAFTNCLATIFQSHFQGSTGIMDIAPCPADHSRHGPSSGGACYMAQPTDFEPETASNSLGQGRYGCLGGSSMFGQKAKEV